MSEKTVIVPVGDTFFKAPEAVKKAMLETFDRMATGLMHLTESDSVEVATVTPPGLEPALGIKLHNPKDPDWISDENAAKALFAALVGAHSRLMHHSLDNGAIMSARLQDLFPHDKDLFEGQEGGEQ